MSAHSHGLMLTLAVLSFLNLYYCFALNKVIVLILQIYMTIDFQFLG